MGRFSWHPNWIVVIGAISTLCLAETRLLPGERTAVWADTIRVQAMVDRQRVPLNGQVELSLRIEGTQQAQPPALELEGFMTQYLGPSTEISMVNGLVASAITHRYLLAPQREGRLTIDPITLQVDGQTFTTEPITIEVLPAASGSSARKVFSGEEERPTPEDVDEALQFQIGVDQTRVYLNQALPIRLQLLLGGAAVRSIQMPTLQADGFLVKPIGQPRQSQVSINGQPSTLMEFEAMVVPIRPGQLPLGPATLTGQLVVRNPRGPARRRASSPFLDEDPFEELFGGGSLFEEFFGQARLYPVTVIAPPVTIEVLPLPSEGQPDGFSGAVGRFTMEATAVPMELAVGEPVTLRVTIQGDGNLEGAGPPTLVGDLAGFKVYEPQRKLEGGAAGRPPRVIVERVVIPLEASVQETPAIHWSFFDPKTAQYHTVSRGPIPLTVNPAPEAVTPPVGRPQTLPPQVPQPEILGRDLVDIREELDRLRPAGEAGSIPLEAAWWSLGPVTLLIVSERLRRRRERLAADPSIARASGALKRALGHCRLAAKLRRDGKVGDCYAQLFRAMQRYVGDRFNLPSEGLTAAELERHLRPRGVPDDVARELSELVHRCDAARFAPRSVAADQAEPTLQAAEAVLRRLDRWRPT